MILYSLYTATPSLKKKIGEGPNPSLIFLREGEAVHRLDTISLALFFSLLFTGKTTKVQLINQIFE